MLTVIQVNDSRTGNGPLLNNKEGEKGDTPSEIFIQLCSKQFTLSKKREVGPGH
jgi:hypothetical protein